MKNKYENNLRTHYAPLKRSKYYHAKNDNCLNKSQNKCKTELIVDKQINNDRDSYYKYKTPIKLLKKESRNNKYFNLEYEKTDDLNMLKKEKLNISFNKVHPYYFQDKIQLKEKEKMNQKIKNRMMIQREALKQLTLYKVKNPSKKEVLQKINELSYNPLLAYEPKSPAYKKTIANYYYNDNIIKNNDINIFNKPRKEIEEYYNKCQYQIPSLYESDTTIHTKKKYIFPEAEKNKFEKQIKEEIIKQRNKKTKLYENKIDEIKKGKIKYKLYNDLDKYIKINEKMEKLNKEKEIVKDNNILTEYNKYIKLHKNDGEKDCYNNIRKKMEKEDLKENMEKKEEKIRTRKLLNDWDNIYKRTKDRRNYENIKEKKMWRNYSETFEINYNTKNKFKNCYRCGKNYSKDNIFIG